MSEIITEHEIGGSFDSDSYFVSSVSVVWKWEDCGIGHYEFWGTVGYDTNMQLEFDGFFVETIDVYDSTDTLVQSIQNTEKNRSLYEDIFEFVIDYVDDEVSGIEPPDEYYEEYDYD